MEFIILFRLFYKKKHYARYRMADSGYKKGKNGCIEDAIFKDAISEDGIPKMQSVKYFQHIRVTRRPFGEINPYRY
jgi:hypothetical protein